MKHHMVSMTAMRLFLKKEGKRISTDAFPLIEAEVQSLLLKAARRAELNGRHSVREQDI